MDRGVLFSARRAALTDVPLAWKSIYVKTRKRTKWVTSIHLHVIVISSIGFPAKKYLERIGSSEKRGKRRVRISVEGVGEVASWPVGRPSTSFKA